MMNSERWFIKIGKKMIDDCCEGLQNGYSFFEDVISVYVYLYSNIKTLLLDKPSDFSLSEMVGFIGQKQRRNEGGINDRIVKALKWLVDNEYVKCNYNNFDNIKPKSNIKFSLYNSYVSKFDGNKIKNSSFVANGGFITIFIDELFTIQKYCFEEKKKFSRVLFMFACIRRRIPRRSSIYDVEYFDRENAYPEVFSTFYSTLAANIGVSEYCVSDSVHILKKLKIFHVERMRTKKIESNEIISSNKDLFYTGLCLICEYKVRDFNKNLIFEGKSYYDKEITAKKEQLIAFQKAYGE